MCPQGKLRSRLLRNWRLESGGQSPHVDQAPLRQPPHPRELRPQIRGEPADDLAPPPLRPLPVQDQPPDLPVQADQLGVHRSRRLHPRRPDANLDLLQELSAPHRRHSTRPRRPAHPAILSHATAGRSGFRQRQQFPPATGWGRRYWHPTHGSRAARRCSRAYPKTCPAMSSLQPNCVSRWVGTLDVRDSPLAATVWLGRTPTPHG